MRYVKKDFYALLALFISLFVFYPNLFTAKTASLMGDHIEQHYPWSYLLAVSIKQLKFPWWTNLIHCGFPIAAEGQIGAFYPLNLILCFLLPIRWAYSYMNVVHFAISGYATYLYARQMRLGFLPSFIAAFVFLFGAAYGGAYYNITSLKTIAWFPLSLFLFEKFWETGRIRYAALLSISNTFSILAGYLQIAILTLLVFIFYVLLRTVFFHERKIFLFSDALGKVLVVIVSLAGTVAFAFPQLWMTYRLALLSNRLHLSESYAYIGSMSPIALLTTFLIEVQGFVRGNSLTSGIITNFFVLCAIHSSNIRKTAMFKIWCWVGLVTLLLALGGWSPFYVALIKLTKFYSFRMPAKFLVFICFAIAMLAGMGIAEIQKMGDPEPSKLKIRKAVKSYLILFLIAVLSHGFIYFTLTNGRETAIQVGKWYIQTFVYRKAGHLYSLDVYFSKLNSSLNSIQYMLSFHDPWNIWNYSLLLVSVFLILSIWKSNRFSRVWLVSALVFLFIDLYGYAWRDIKRDFDTYDHIYKPSPIVEYLKKEQSVNKLHRIAGLRKEGENLPIVPSMNILYGFEDIGAYSPFVLKRYHETIGQFGNINDSNLAFPSSPAFLKDHLNILDFLDVSHILSTEAIKSPAFELLLNDSETKTYLYRNKGNFARASFVQNMEVFKDWGTLKMRFLEPGFDPSKTVLFENDQVEKIEKMEPKQRAQVSLKNIQHDSDLELWEIEVQGPGFFVISNVMYPGWTSTVNGKPTPILSACGLFQAVWIEKAGKYLIGFHYKPF